jgi:hypothetical protein
MEKAVFISKTEQLNYVNKNFSRLYFGTEFCERLIQQESQLGKVLSFAKKNDLDFTYVTPYATNLGLKIIEKNVLIISKELNNAEVVVNDWGVLKLICKYPVKPVLGRLLSKQKRDARILNLIGKSPKLMIAHFKKSNLELPIYQDFLNKRGINRVEIDNVFQGTDLDFSSLGLKASIYYPYIYVTTTRRCLINSCDSISKRDIIGIYPCNKECQKYTIELKHTIMPKKIILKGNTQFLYNPELPARLEEKGINRTIFQPEIPM